MNREWPCMNWKERWGNETVVSRKVDSDYTAELTVDDLYAEFKRRLMAELAAVKPAGTAIYVDGVEVRYLPLVDKEQL